MKLFCVILFTFSSFIVFGQNTMPTSANEKSFPTNIDSNNFNDIKNFDGEIISFDGEIKKIEISRNKTPFYKLEISENNFLWAVLMFKNEMNKIGDKIRIVGYLRTAKPNETEKKYLDGKFMVIAFGLIDFENSSFLFLSGAGEQKQEWIDGKIPSSK